MRSRLFSVYICKTLLKSFDVDNGRVTVYGTRRTRTSYYLLCLIYNFASKKLLIYIDIIKYNNFHR